MTILQIINQLEINKEIFKGLLSSKSKDEYLWRPEPKKWCILEIVCHLFDEERDDFRARVKHTLETPLVEMPSINPEDWVLEHDYISQNYTDILQAFLNERNKSVIWLKKSVDAKWNNIYQHPKLGPMSAKLFLSNWLAHDYLHFRQINRHQYLYFKEKINIDLQYAGNW
ncbi:DinB family protein [Confluentibacter lentus]|uniref:DinB family protein n=1 Tax=Confluentibacter lentus TaxID=1699412 RepID=UPI000C288D9F|nr:DinB family protein [Confluentibacter lentus]